MIGHTRKPSPSLEVYKRNVDVAVEDMVKRWGSVDQVGG